MSARVLLSGVLHKAPERKTSKNNKEYLIASIRENNGGANRWWKVLIFSESAIEFIDRLVAGDPVQASGTFDARIWTPDGGEPRVNLTMTADAILSARGKPKADRGDGR